MHLQTHLAASWIIGSALVERRDRRLVAWAGVVPDLDAISLLWGVDAYARWHHVLTHSLLAAVAVGLATAIVARARIQAALLAFVAFHLHLALDLVGSGVGWSIAYLYPFSSHELVVAGAWDLASWQNLVATVLFLGYSLRCAVTSQRSFVEAWMPAAVDQAFCALVARTWARTRKHDRRARLPGAE